MPRKEPLYFKTSKAAKQLEYDFYSESEKPGRVKPQKTKEWYKYKRTNDYPYYEDQHNERRRHKYDEDLYFDSDYTYDLDYATEHSSDSSDSGSILEGHYRKENKNRKKRQSENVVYNNNKKHKERNNFRKQIRPPLNYDEDRIIRDNKDFSVYISQRPITLQYESQDDLIEPLGSVTQRRRKSKEHKGSKIPTSKSKSPADYEVYMADLNNIPSNKVFGQQQQGDILQGYSTLTDSHIITSPTNFKELTTNISRSIAQSLLRLIYLPVLVMSNNMISQSIGSIEPVLLVKNTNKHPDGTDVRDGSQNLMSVFTAHNNDQNIIFQQKTKSVNKERDVLTPNKRSKEDIRKERVLDAHKKKELKNKLYASSLGAAMSAESYASLIASHPEQTPTQGGTLPSLLKVCKELKKKKGATPHNEVELYPDGNEHQKKSSKVKPDNSFKEMTIPDSYSLEDHITNQEIKKQKSEIKSPRKNNKSVYGEESNKKRRAKEIKTLPQMKSTDLKQVDDGNSIIININKKSLISNALSHPSQIKEKEINLDINGTESRNVVVGQQAVGDHNTSLSQNQSNTNKKPSLVSKNYSRTSQDTMITGNYKKVGHNQSCLNSLRSFAIPEGERSFVMGQTSDIGKNNLELKENNCTRVIDSANIHRPKAIAQTEEGSKKCFTKGDSQFIFEAHDTGFAREISLDELKPISGPNIQKEEENELLHNPKSILKKEYIITGINGQEEREMNHKNCREETLGKAQQENTNLTRSTSNTAQATKKHLLVFGDKDQEVDQLGEAPQSSHEELYGEDVEQHLQIEPSLDYQSVHEQYSEHFLIEPLEGNCSLKIIHPPTEKSSTQQSANNILFLQSKEPDELLNYHPSNFYEYTEAILFVSFQTAKLILGVSFYDKLINVIDFFYYEDD